jgi:lipoprotein-anchoring transpeptidase ErfK/SrfK
MHWSRLLAAAAAAAVLAATLPQLAQAREIVGFSDSYSSGTVVVKTSQRALYYVLGNGKAVRYPVGVGRVGKQWTGTAFIIGKQLRPAWSPPAEVKRDKPSLPNVIPGGSPGNPMGAAALTLSGGGEYAIHPRHQQPRLDRRLRLLRLHSHAQCGRARSLQSGWLGDDGRRDPLIGRSQ